MSSNLISTDGQNVEYFKLWHLSMQIEVFSDILNLFLFLNSILFHFDNGITSHSSHLHLMLRFVFTSHVILYHLMCLQISCVFIVHVQIKTAINFISFKLLALDANHGITEKKSKVPRVFHDNCRSISNHYRWELSPSKINCIFRKEKSYNGNYLHDWGLDLQHKLVQSQGKLNVLKKFS